MLKLTGEFVHTVFDLAAKPVQGMSLMAIMLWVDTWLYLSRGAGLLRVDPASLLTERESLNLIISICGYLLSVSFLAIPIVAALTVMVGSLMYTYSTATKLKHIKYLDEKLKNALPALNPRNVEKKNKIPLSWMKEYAVRSRNKFVLDLYYKEQAEFDKRQSTTIKNSCVLSVFFVVVFINYATDTGSISGHIIDGISKLPIHIFELSLIPPATYFLLLIASLIELVDSVSNESVVCDPLLEAYGQRDIGSDKAPIKSFIFWGARK